MTCSLEIEVRKVDGISGVGNFDVKSWPKVRSARRCYGNISDLTPKIGK